MTTFAQSHSQTFAAVSPRSTLRLALPKGRMQAAVAGLLTEAGIACTIDDRTYRPTIGLADVDVKLLKPQNIIEMLDAGSRDIGFAGADWVAELNADVVELLDTGFDPVRIVAAAPRELLDSTGSLPEQPLRIATEYVNLTASWMKQRSIVGRVIRSFGATEVFPPEDADCIVDNTATGSTLRANGLAIVDELCRSSTRLYANPRSLDQPDRRQRIDEFVLLLNSVLEARTRIMIELNVSGSQLDAVIALLPCMREPTIASLHGSDGFAVKAAVPRDQLPTLIPQIKQAGGADIVVTKPSQIVP